MKLDIFDFGLYGENCYVIHEAGHVLFIDPGRFAKKLMQNVQKDEIVDGIVLTHGHEDHTGAVDDLVDEYHCKVYMNLEDYPLVDPNQSRHGYDCPIYAPIESLMNQQQIGTFKIGYIILQGIQLVLAVFNIRIVCLLVIHYLLVISVEQIYI